MVWDVGHQAYPHKLITGRYADFDSLRQKGGVAGYLKRCESTFDHFGAGHASTSISAALGMAMARDRLGQDHKCVAVIGDGALTGGMALEAINHAGHMPNTPLLVVLNDNDMSISPPVGALSSHLNRMRLSPPMQFLSGSVEESMRHLPFMGGDLPAELNRLKGSMRRLAVPKVGAVFEELGFTYMGPVDGHDIAEMMRTFQEAHRVGGPVLVHVLTTKGKGYPYAEADQVGYHAQSAFDLNTGKARPSKTPKPPSYSKVFGQTLVKICEQNPRVVGITAAMMAITLTDSLILSVTVITLSNALTAFSIGGFATNHLDIAPNQSGLLMGVTNTLAAVSSSVSVFVSGWIQDLSGGWDAVFLTAAGVSVFGAVIYGSLSGVEREFD